MSRGIHSRQHPSVNASTPVELPSRLGAQIKSFLDPSTPVCGFVSHNRDFVCFRALHNICVSARTSGTCIECTTVDIAAEFPRRNTLWDLCDRLAKYSKLRTLSFRVRKGVTCPPDLVPRVVPMVLAGSGSPQRFLDVEIVPLGTRGVGNRLFLARLSAWT